MKEKTLTISGNEFIPGGEVIVRKPLAGPRNKAMVKAETPDGVKETVFMLELLPYAIKTHPWGTVTVRDGLDKLDPEEYDLLIDALRELLVEGANALKKKLKSSLNENQPEESDQK